MPRKKITLGPGDEITARSALYKVYSADEIDGKKIKRIAYINRNTNIKSYPDHIQKIFQRKRSRRRTRWPWKIVQLADGKWLPLSSVKFKYKEERIMKKQIKLSEILKENEISEQLPKGWVHSWNFVDSDYRVFRNWEAAIENGYTMIIGMYDVKFIEPEELEDWQYDDFIEAGWIDIEDKLEESAEMKTEQKLRKYIRQEIKKVLSENYISDAIVEPKADSELRKLLKGGDYEQLSKQLKEFDEFVDVVPDFDFSDFQVEGDTFFPIDSAEDFFKYLAWIVDYSENFEEDEPAQEWEKATDGIRTIGNKYFPSMF